LKEQVGGNLRVAHCHKFSTRSQWRFQMRDYITTITEAIGATMISVGIGFVLGLGAALIAGGILIVVGSILADFGGNK
jgi:uncharacterized membrane protein YkgB